MIRGLGGDGPWLTGVCWLYCRRQGVPVLAIGSVTAAPGGTKGLYACRMCVAELEHMVRGRVGVVALEITAADGPGCGRCRAGDGAAGGGTAR
ncbi:hypothetical protein ABZX40_35090 [Streptomyces sp. NPDC004610]|uniref:hypothetical protein n=1 Tax=unclassified Streptomyces TaxID=2593676 RepID=UPI0033BB7897